MEQPGWVAEAWAHLFARERAGGAHNPEIMKFFKDAGHGEITRDEVPWCAAFVGACLERDGLSGSGSLMARSYLNWGEAIEQGRFGAIAVLKRGSNPSAGHVGFLLGETDDHYVLLGGNQSDAVSVARYPKHRLLGLRWPETANSRDSVAADEMFEHALVHVLEMEGGFTDDPQDPGGPTNKGITLATYARFLKRRLNSDTKRQLVDELKAISPAVVREIYSSRYWRPSRGNVLPPALSLMHFDAAVNHGVGGAARMLQQALGVDVDGEIGPLTLAAARQRKTQAVVSKYADIRRARYRSLHHFPRFGRGWLRRVERTLKRAGELREAVLERAPGDDRIDQQKGHDMKEPTEQQTGQKWWGSSMTIWGAAITALSTVVPVVAPAIGLDITPELVKQVGGQLVVTVQAIGGLIGTAMTIYGRSRARPCTCQRPSQRKIAR